MKLERKKALERSKNYRQQVMLEEQRARRSKKSSFIEDEAEEEEEEGLAGGLADYGFGTGTKDKEHNDESNALKVHFLLIDICNFYVLSHLLLIFICKLPGSEAAQR